MISQPLPRDSTARSWHRPAAWRRSDGYDKGQSCFTKFLLPFRSPDIPPGGSLSVQNGVGVPGCQRSVLHHPVATTSNAVA